MKKFQLFFMKRKKLLQVLVYTFLFFIFIFIFDTFFFEQDKKQYSEEEFIDISSYEDMEEEKFSDIGIINKEDKKKYYSIISNFFEEKENVSYTWEKLDTNENILDKQEEKKLEKEVLNKEKQYKITYTPENFSQEAFSYTDSIIYFLDLDFVSEKISSLLIELNKEIYDVRGKFKDKTIKMFWVKNMNNDEFLSVFIHEFGHYVDLYFLVSWDTSDVSNYFYNVSWTGTKIIKSWEKQGDFVSWYAMTNKYEDFAESFTYYILHNEDFFKKAQESTSLMEKYSFFWKYVFDAWEFKKTNFWDGLKIEPYYWDITKIDINLEKLLQFF